MNIFLDVGGHEGQTLQEVLRPAYRFDVIHCFEPQRECYELLKRKFGAYLGGRLVLHNFGLADFDGEKELYGEGIGASLFPDKRDVDNREIQKCRFVRASSFFCEHINAGNLVVMKLNCEGGEVLILRDLIQSAKIHLLSNVMIDFDIRKVPSKKHEQGNIINELNEAGFKNYINEKETMIGITHQASIRFWLSNLDNAEEFMNLTPEQRTMRWLPFGLRRFLQKKHRKLHKIILGDKRPDYYTGG